MGLRPYNLRSLKRLSLNAQSLFAHLIMNQQDNSGSFYGLGIAPNLLKRLEELHFKTPTPIQHKSIPVGISGEDVVGIAQTGTGKTLAFAVPMIQRISIVKCMGLILLPTRELAIQVDEAVHKLAQPFGIRTAVIIGGAPMNKQIQALRKHPHIIIGTPGRLNDHIQQKTIVLSGVGVLVLDEADRMLDMGFEPQIRKILAMIPVDRQTMLFSATMPDKISKIARTYMKKPLRVEVAPSGTAAERVEQEVFMVPKNQKGALLVKVLSEYKGTVLVFSRTKHGAKKIARDIKNAGHTAAELHSNRSLNQRREALDGFKSGKYRVLVATDIAARGIDVMGIELVINYDLPDQAEDYVHRIGRTARAGRAGKAISFASPEQKRDIQTIEGLIRTRLAVSPLPKLAPLPHAPAMPERAFTPRPQRGYAPRHSGNGGSGGRRGGGFRGGDGRHRGGHERGQGGRNRHGGRGGGQPSQQQTTQ